MKLTYHLYSYHFNCGNCMHARKAEHPIEIADDLYCGIIGSGVSKEYSCDFYRKRPKEKPNETNSKARDEAKEV